MAEPGYGLLLEFDTDDSEFVRGVEVGRLWEMFKRDADEFEQHIHASNAEMTMRIAEATDRTYEAEELGDGWMMLKVVAQ